jgi:p-cumate 2,3-dioxygenase subunit beta
MSSMEATEVTDVRAATDVTRSDVEEFLFEEAAILDAWELKRWLTLFEEGAVYEVPATDLRRGDPRSEQLLIADDWHNLQARVRRLLRPDAHAENPRSRTHRLITNVRVTDRGPDWVDVSASFLVHRIKDFHVDPYLGRYDHRLVVNDKGLRFRRRRAILDLERVQPGGRISMVL